MENTPGRIAKLINTWKDLKKQKEEWSSQLTEQKTKMKMLQKDKKEYYKQCEEMGIDPENIEEEIEKRLKDIASTLKKYENKIDKLKFESNEYVNYKLTED